jgi:hypothetical protein
MSNVHYIHDWHIRLRGRTKLLKVIGLDLDDNNTSFESVAPKDICFQSDRMREGVILKDIWIEHDNLDDVGSCLIPSEKSVEPDRVRSREMPTRHLARCHS